MGSTPLGYSPGATLVGRGGVQLSRSLTRATGNGTTGQRDELKFDFQFVSTQQKLDSKTCETCVLFFGFKPTLTICHVRKKKNAAPGDASSESESRKVGKSESRKVPGDGVLPPGRTPSSCA